MGFFPRHQVTAARRSDAARAFETSLYGLASGNRVGLAALHALTGDEDRAKIESKAACWNHWSHAARPENDALTGITSPRRSGGNEPAPLNATTSTARQMALMPEMAAMNQRWRQARMVPNPAVQTSFEHSRFQSRPAEDGLLPSKGICPGCAGRAGHFDNCSPTRCPVR